MENLFKKAEALANQGKCEDLMALISKLEVINCLHPDLLNLKARCIQTTEEPTSASLEDVQKSLEEAITLDNTYFPAFVELAYFQLNVMDNAEAALPLFERAIEIINHIATEAILGKANCLAELKSKEDAINYVEQAKRNVIKSDKMQEFLDDLSIYSSN